MTDKPVIREYQDTDFQYLVYAMEQLQQHVISVDPYHLNQMNDGYGEAYAKKSLERVRTQNGKIYSAFLGEKFLGCIIGILEEGNIYEGDDPLQDCVVGRTGEIIELIVLPESRGLGIGKMLMNIMEDYFRQSDCAYVYLDVFGPNEKTYEFYQKLGYTDRMITMSKPL